LELIMSLEDIESLQVLVIDNQLRTLVFLYEFGCLMDISPFLDHQHSFVDLFNVTVDGLAFGINAASLHHITDDSFRGDGVVLVWLAQEVLQDKVGLQLLILLFAMSAFKYFETVVVGSSCHVHASRFFDIIPCQEKRKKGWILHPFVS